jgi:uncharacterized protein (TIGR03437 family)
MRRFHMMFAVRLPFLLAGPSLIAWCQKPVIFPDGVVNAASYQPGNTTPQNETSLSGGSIISIFGQNLAATTQTATVVPLPPLLAGTSVTVGGIAAPLFFVSPGQINAQMPTLWLQSTGPPGLVVSTAAGMSDPYLFGPPQYGAIGIFTNDSTGCGQAAVLNVSSDGTVSLNSSSNSVSPGEYVSVYATGLGLVSNSPPDGAPAQSTPPLATASMGAGLKVDLASQTTSAGADYWTGRAPGLIGVDQVNDVVPDTVREGCAVPLQLEGYGSASQPVTFSIHAGGGPCSDPPPAGFGQITWQKTVTTSTTSTSETDVLTVSLQASPGKQAPPVPVYTESNTIYERSNSFGPSCPVPGYRSLDAGAVTIQGPGFGSMQAAPAPLQQVEVPVSGLTAYLTVLPSGSIQPGSFTVVASGGADVGAFQSKVQIGSGIQVTTALAGKAFNATQPITVNWTGGDPDTWLTFKVVSPNGASERTASVQAHASDGTVTMDTVGDFLPIVADVIEMILEVTPDPAQTPSFSAAGLSLGGQNLWKYTYKFEGISIP